MKPDLFGIVDVKGYFQRGFWPPIVGIKKVTFEINWRSVVTFSVCYCQLPARPEGNSWTFSTDPPGVFCCLWQPKKNNRRNSQGVYRLQTQIAMNSSRLMSPIIARSLLDYAGRNTYATLQLFVVFLGTVDGVLHREIGMGPWKSQVKSVKCSTVTALWKKYHLAPGNGMSAFVCRQPPGTFFLNRKFSKKRFWPFSPATWHGDRKVEVPVQQLKLKQSSSRPHTCWKNHGSKTGHHSYSICGAVPYIALVCRAEIWDVEVWFQCSNMFGWHKHSDFIFEFAITTCRNRPYNTTPSLSVRCDTLSPPNWTIEWVSQHPRR